MTSSTLANLILLMAIPAVVVSAQENAPERTVHANAITSKRDPSLRIELPERARYVGADRWILYNVADCEIHVFVEADEQNNVQRLYWIQFEGYLPSKPDSKYSYSFAQSTKLAGIDFDVRVRVGTNDDEPRSGSDLEHVRKLITEKGYKLPPGMVSARLVHLLDEQKRKELMIIYGEDVASTGFSAADLIPGGKGYAQWPAIEKDFTQRAEKRLTLRKIPE